MSVGGEAVDSEYFVIKMISDPNTKFITLKLILTTFHNKSCFLAISRIVFSDVTIPRAKTSLFLSVNEELG